jgi:hypothetical protein
MESTTLFPCEQLPGREPRDDLSQGTIAANCSELVCRALLDIGGQPRRALRAGAADSHKSRQVVEAARASQRGSERERRQTVPIRFGVFVPQGWRMDLAEIDDPIEQYETMTSVARVADE